ncbi:carbohydrate kinase [Solitalea longa]|uniref:Carbohydrate kinase n=1 Tax=Solitalea longa TaxID=2079460 RepID=A0A2S5A2V0_9SPHI|nr:carbohydrate kinase [Solitalea longa]POY36612.1 carbohydrate kinase [Solitalea longa]
MENKINVACFGEVLWDIFPGKEKKLGGAPFNVAYHLFKMGATARMISSIGNDELGREIIEKIQKWNMTVDGISIAENYPTSTVIADIDEHNDAHYTISENVAWDYNQPKQDDIAFLEQADALVFGSLGARSKVSEKALFELIEKSRFNVFDINLRKPFYNINLINELLKKAHLGKFNKAEMLIVLESFGKEYTTERDGVKFLQDKFDLKEIIVSKGSKGALYAIEDQFYLCPAVPVQVKDTVGSGDSFLAGFLSKRLQKGATPYDIMSQAVTLGAFITSSEGACPEYTLQEFESFKKQQSVSLQPV